MYTSLSVTIILYSLLFQTYRKFCKVHDFVLIFSVEVTCFKQDFGTPEKMDDISAGCVSLDIVNQSQFFGK